MSSVYNRCWLIKANRSLTHHTWSGEIDNKHVLQKTLFTFSCSYSCQWQMVANQQSFITVTEPMPVSALCRSWVKNMFWRFVFKRQRLLVLVKTVIKFCKRACNSGTPWMPCNERIITAHMICVRRPSSSRIPLWVFLIISCLYERHVTIKVVAHLYCLQNAFHCTHALQKKWSVRYAQYCNLWMALIPFFRKDLWWFKKCCKMGMEKCCSRDASKSWSPTSSWESSISFDLVYDRRSTHTWEILLGVRKLGV